LDSSDKLSLYLHIPYCTKKCDYCDFFSIPVENGSDLSKAYTDHYYTDHYIDALLKETERRLLENCPVNVPSIYIGGGTPSLLGADGITRLLDGLHSLSCPREITVEANPETADIPFLESCANHGVTRLSLGVQSFDPGLRSALGRQGDSVILPDRLSAAGEIFGPRLSLDLICASIYPKNSSSPENGSGIDKKREILMRDIDKALSYGPGHVSFYALMLEEGTPLAARLAGNNPAEEEQLWLDGRDALLRAGYEQYEISNFTLSSYSRGLACIHNIRYWRLYNWIGIGPGASGTIINEDGSGKRTSYALDIEAFISGKSDPITEYLDRLTVIKESFLMGYRYIEGPDPVLFNRRFGKTIEEIIPKTLAKWQNGVDEAAFREKRMLFLNAFLLDTFLELDNNISQV
jgi:oxygen-independent coproporphyrinogen-3 oxidase